MGVRHRTDSNSRRLRSAIVGAFAQVAQIDNRSLSIVHERVHAKVHFARRRESIGRNYLFLSAVYGVYGYIPSGPTKVIEIMSSQINFDARHNLI